MSNCVKCGRKHDSTNPFCVVCVNEVGDTTKGRIDGLTITTNMLLEKILEELKKLTKKQDEYDEPFFIHIQDESIALCREQVREVVQACNILGVCGRLEVSTYENVTYYLIESDIDLFLKWYNKGVK